MNDSRDTGRTLTSALRAVAADDQALGASADVEARLRAEVRAIARARRRRANVLGLAAAAALFVGIAVPWRYWPGRAPVDATGPTATDVATREETTAFFPLTYSGVPAASPHLIRLEVPRTALASFGITSFEPPDDSSTVLADVVVGDDGLARAVRFVRVVSYYEQQELQP